MTKPNGIAGKAEALIGNTPLVRLAHLPGDSGLFPLAAFLLGLLDTGQFTLVLLMPRQDHVCCGSKTVIVVQFRAESWPEVL